MAKSEIANGSFTMIWKRFLSNEYNVLTTRMFVGVLLLTASIDKIADPAAFAQSIEDYRVISGPVVTILATTIPWMELLCGLAMIFGIVVPGASLLAGSLLFVFTLAVVSALLRGLDITCGCFTQDPNAARLGWLKVAENFILIAVTVYLYFSTSIRFSLEQYLLDRHKSP